VLVTVLRHRSRVRGSRNQDAWRMKEVCAPVAGVSGRWSLDVRCFRTDYREVGTFQPHSL